VKVGIMAKQSTPSGIIFDQPYTNGLLVKSLEAGYAKVTFQSDYVTGILQKARNPTVGIKALEMLLLYDKVYTVDWFDNIDSEQLHRLGILEIVNSQWQKKTIDEEYAKSIKGLLLTDLQRKGVKISSTQFDELLPDVNSLYFGKIAVLAQSMILYLICSARKLALQEDTHHPTLI
jgi:hypothetical protein